MLDLKDFGQYFDTLIVITLMNGKEKEGVLISIDKEANTIKISDENNKVIPIMVSLIGMVEPKQVSTKSENPIVAKEVLAIETPQEEKTEIKPIQESDKNSNVLSSILKIEANFDAGIKNASLHITAPSFEMPIEILELEHRTHTEDRDIWISIKNKYDSSRKMGALLPNSDGLRSLINKAKGLLINPKLYKSPSIYAHLAYLYYLNDNQGEAERNYKLAAKLSNKPQDWLNLAAVSIEKEENEMACYALERLFLQAACTEEKYEKAWCKFIEFVMDFCAYSSVRNILLFATRPFIKEEELQKVFYSACYLLLKKGNRKKVEDFIEKSLTNRDYKKMSLDVFEFLPLYETKLSYNRVKKDFDELVKIESNLIKYNISTIKTSPTVANSYELFKQARNARDVAKDYEKARKLFIEGIEKEKSPVLKQGAVRDLASMLAQLLNEPLNAIEVIKKYQNVLSEADLNLLYNFNFQLGRYEDAVKIQKKLLDTTKVNLKAVRYSQIAACYLRMKNYTEAEKNYRNALKTTSINTPAANIFKRNIALCLYQEGKIEDAKKLLNEVVTKFSDPNAIKLLDTIEGRITNSIENLFIDTIGIAFENIDGFISYYLSMCDLKYVEKGRLSKDGKYAGTEENKRYDIKKLEDTASTLRSRIAEERSNLYLNAARILFDLGEQGNDFYKYLCRSFASKGDSATQSNNHIDSVRTYYLTALKAYDALYFDEEQSQKRDEQDAVNALCRFLFSFLGRDRIPLAGDKNLSIKETVNSVFSEQTVTGKLFDSIKIAFARSPQYVMNRILQLVFADAHLKKQVCTQLGLDSTIVNAEQVVEKYKTDVEKILKMENQFSEQLGMLRGFQLAEIWLTSSMDRIKALLNKVFFELDERYLGDLLNLLDLCVSLCKASSFDDKNRQCEDIAEKAKNHLTQIERNPTKLSIEEISPIIKGILSTLKTYLDALYEASRPELVFSSAIASYHVKDNNYIDLHIKIENKNEGHAEQVDFFVQKNDSVYDLINKENISFGTIRGKSQQIEMFTLKLTVKAITAKAFSLKAFAKFKTGQDEPIITEVQEIPIQLGNVEDFIPAENKYGAYAESAEVKEITMFFGRENIIENIYNAVCNNYKSFVFYGQKRAGKSSILYHLAEKIKTNPNILIANVGNIGSIFDFNSEVSFLYQILWSILKKIEYAVEDKIYEENYPEITFTLPRDIDFYKHPAPLQLFKDLLDKFKREIRKQDKWKNVRILVLIDEFTYIYTCIVGGRIVTNEKSNIFFEVPPGKIDPTFLVVWKSLLQENYFSVVLVAQDFYPKFKALDANAFQTMQSERVSYLAEEDAKRLIDEPIRIGGIDGESRYAEKAIDRIYELTAGSAFYIQIFCDKLVDYVNQDRVTKITEANVNKVLKESMMRLDKGVFDNLTNDGDTSPDAILKEDSEAVLREIAKHTQNQPHCNRTQITCVTQKSIDEILHNLYEREVIEKNKDGYYRIRIGLFKEWLNKNPI